MARLGLSYTRLDYGVNAADRGYLAESFPIHHLQGNTAPAVAGRLEFVKLRLPSTASVTNIVMYVNTIGSTLTAGQCFAVLYDSAGTRVGVTADQAATWSGTTGAKAMALASGPFTCQAGFYFVAFWYNGTTAPAWIRGTSSAAINAGFAAPNLLNGSADTGLTTTSPASMGAQTAQSTHWWAALS